MAIIFHEETRTWHLTNAQISYIIRVMENGELENLYTGSRIHDRSDFLHLHDREFRAHMASCVPEPDLLGLQFTRQEYPSYGTGDFRSPAYSLLQENGSRISNFRYTSHRIFQGKDPLDALPAVYVTDPEEAWTLEIDLTDPVTGLQLTLSYSVFRDLPVIARHVVFRNQGPQTLMLEQALSASFEFPDSDFRMIHLAGAWARERYVKERPLEMGIQSIQGLNGTCSGAEHNPFLALARADAGEDTGDVFGFSLIYSGNFLAQTEVTTYDLTRVMIGINPLNFCWKLAPGEAFCTPEAVLVISDQGIGKMSRVFHQLFLKHLMRGKWQSSPRPILLNNWEATYFHFNEEKLLQIAEKAKEAGVELFVLDDGWFGERNDDLRGLGDWFVNEAKLPSGLAGLSQKINDLGLMFGLWVELEMINKDSRLYREHPDWLIGAPDRFESITRHQHVLDFSRDEVVDAIYEMMARILKDANISYIKWDMNRYMSEPFGGHLPADRQGEFMHRYILGLYRLYDRLTREFPEILFESCASGGARFDPGMLYYAPQAWASDDTDASERQKIQYGTSYLYPLVSMGSHVSAVPNHQLLRTTPLQTRANVAYFGTFGYELDLNLLSDKEFEEVRREIRFMKEHRQLLQMDGELFRILSPFEGNAAAWIVVAPDKSEAIAFYGQRLGPVNASYLRLRLKGLDPDKKYRVTWNTTPVSDFPIDLMKIYGIRIPEGDAVFEAYGDELMQAGIPIDRNQLLMKGGDFASLLFVLNAE